MLPYRSFVVWGIGLVVVLGSFMGFTLFGWGSGNVNNCIPAELMKLPAPKANASVAVRNKYQDKVIDGSTCYCEAFWPPDVESGATGVRQSSNTWFNLYAVFTSFLVATIVFVDRQRGTVSNPIGASDLVPDLWVFVVQFLGLGSMWFHGSLKSWGGVFDLLSMFAFASFLIFYSVRRFWDSDLFFWLGYVLTVTLFTILGSVIQGEYVSLVLILILVAAYLSVEIYIWVHTKQWALGTLLTQFLWIAAVVCILTATVFWKLSQTGGPLCNPYSAFQPHGILWHPLAGAMALFLYFYWRQDTGQ